MLLTRFSSASAMSLSRYAVGWLSSIGRIGPHIVRRIPRDRCHNGIIHNCCNNYTGRSFSNDFQDETGEEIHSPEIFPLPEGIDGTRVGLFELVGTEGTGPDGKGLRAVLGVHGPREYWDGAGPIESAGGGMFAVVQTSGRQYKVVAGDTLYTHRLPGEVNTSIAMDKVVLIGTMLWTVFGRPMIPGALVRATVEAQTLTGKVIVTKFKKRKGYRRKAGHRQPITRLHIDKVEYNLPHRDLIVPYEVKLDPRKPPSANYPRIL